MLDLDDPRWGELRHAYGAASDIPGLLRALASSPGPSGGAEDEPWFSLWSSLCHQGDVYTASYAAVPHIVTIASETCAPIDFSFFALPASIEVSRQSGRGPQVPADIADAYDSSLARLGDCVSLHRNDGWTKEMLLATSAAQAVSNGHFEVAEALMNLDDHWIARINSFDEE